MHALLITGGLLFAITGAAMADDHLFNAGVDNPGPAKNNAGHPTGHFEGSTASLVSHATTTNKAGNGGDLANGQGSPFAGADRGTPSNDIGNGNPGPNGRANSAPGHTKQ
jgi:hypothetical protein